MLVEIEDARTFAAASRSSDRYYFVTITPRGGHCTCTGYQRRQSCRHVLEAHTKVRVVA